jgi:hypothetical protein
MTARESPRHACLARGVAPQRHQGPCGGPDERSEVVWPRTHPVERGPRQHRGFAVLDPWPLGKRLARGAVAVTTGMRRVPLAPTGRTVGGVAATRRGTAGGAVPHALLRRGWPKMGPAGGRAREAEEIGDCPRWGAGRALCCVGWAGGGVRRPGVTPVEAGPCPRRAGGRTGCGASRETGGGLGGPAWWSRATDGPAASGASGRRPQLRAEAWQSNGDYSARGITDTALRPISWKVAMTFVPYRNCSATKMSAPPWSIGMCSRLARKRCAVLSICSNPRCASCLPDAVLSGAERPCDYKHYCSRRRCRAREHAQRVRRGRTMRRGAQDRNTTGGLGLPHR